MTKKAEKMLSKEMNAFLKEKNMKPEDFIKESCSFKNHWSIRHTKQAIEIYKEVCKRNIIIWNY